MKTMLRLFAAMLFTMLAISQAWAITLYIPMKVQFSLNAVVQEDETGTDPIVKYNTSKKTIHSSDIIDLIGAELGQTFSDKAKLWYTTGTEIFSVTDGPSVTVDVTTTLLSMTFDNTNITQKGKRNSNTGKYDYVYHKSVTITYGPDKAGNSFTITGSDADGSAYSFTQSARIWTKSLAINPLFGNGLLVGSKAMQIIGGSVHMNGKYKVTLP